MPEKIIAALMAVVAALLLGSTVMASAQTRTHQPDAGFYSERMAASRGAFRDPYAGTVWENVAPYGSHDMPDPYAGTVWEGVAPY